MMPYLPDGLSKGKMKMYSQSKTTPLVGGIIGQTGEMNTQTSVGSASTPVHGDASARYCIGERICSFRDLVKRPTQQTPCTIMAGNPLVSYRPFSIGWAGAPVTAGVPSYNSGSGDLMSVIASCYAYNRGGVRLKYLLTNSSNLEAYVTNCDDSSISSSPWTAITDPDIEFAESAATTSQQLFEISVPAYQYGHSRLLRPYVGFDNILEPVDPFSGKTCVRIINHNTTSFKTYERAGAEDYECGFFLGIPPMVDVHLFVDVEKKKMRESSANLSGVHTPIRAHKLTLMSTQTLSPMAVTPGKGYL